MHKFFVISLSVLITLCFIVNHVNGDVQNFGVTNIEGGLIRCSFGINNFRLEDNVNKNRNLIVGGDDADIEDIPYQVSLRSATGSSGFLWLRRDFSHICGGSIIKEDRILSAAHCVVDESKDDLQIRAGSSLNSEGGQIRGVIDMWIHPSYINTRSGNDIAVLKLRSDLDFNNKVKPIALPSKGYIISNGAMLLISGWGHLKEGGHSSEQLKKVEVPIVSNRDCDQVYSFNIIKDMLCAGIAGKDSCQGDSGGPMVYNNQVVGVVSTGKGCGRVGIPGVYTRVSEFRDFIDDHLTGGIINDGLRR